MLYSLPDLLDFLLDLGLRAGARPELLDGEPEPEVLVAVLLLHVGHQIPLSASNPSPIMMYAVLTPRSP